MATAIKNGLEICGLNIGPLDLVFVNGSEAPDAVVPGEVDDKEDMFVNILYSGEFAGRFRSLGQ